MLTNYNSLNSSYSSNSTSSSVNNLAESIIIDVQKIEKVHALFDKATLLYERGEYRKAFLYFDICVTAKQDDAKYRLSRAICAFALNVFELTFQDAMISMKYKEVQERDTSTKEIKRVLSDKLLITLKADHRRHLARCKYWMARANYAQGDYEGALRDLDDSENYMESKKAQELMLICQERKKQGLSSLFYNTAPSRNRKLFCDEISIVDDYSNFTIYHLKPTSSYKEYKIPPHLTRSRLQHPTDAQLPITLLGTFAIFDREIYLQEKFQQIQKLIKIQQNDIQARKMQLYQQYRKEVQLLESTDGILNKEKLPQEDDLMIRFERLNE